MRDVQIEIRRIFTVMVSIVSHTKNYQHQLHQLRVLYVTSKCESAYKRGELKTRANNKVEDEEGKGKA